jgi:hypothetical protein
MAETGQARPVEKNNGRLRGRQFCLVRHLNQSGVSLYPWREITPNAMAKRLLAV